MIVKCRKAGAKDWLVFSVTFTEDEIRSYKHFGHELKCFLINEEHKNKDTNNYIFYDCNLVESSKPEFATLQFKYYNRFDTELVLDFSITFPKDKDFRINNITLRHATDNTFIKDSDTLFRGQSSIHVKEILEHLLNRYNLGFYCGTCKHKLHHNLIPQCYKLFEINIKKLTSNQ